MRISYSPEEVGRILSAWTASQAARINPSLQDNHWELESFDEQGVTLILVERGPREIPEKMTVREALEEIDPDH